MCALQHVKFFVNKTLCLYVDLYHIHEGLPVHFARCTVSAMALGVNEVRIVRRGRGSMYIDASDVQSLLQRLQFSNRITAACSSWTTMKTLWALTTDLEHRLFVLEADVEKMLNAIGFRICNIPRKPQQELAAITIQIDGKAYAVCACPVSWYVRDVIVALRCLYPYIARIISIYDPEGWEVRTVQDGPPLLMTACLKSVQSTTWILMHRRTMTEQIGTQLVLRGFLFSFSESDVWNFLRDNKASGHVCGLRLIMSKKFKKSMARGPHFSGLVDIYLNSDSNVDEFKSRVHHAWSGDRYIEVLQSTSRSPNATYYRDNTLSLLSNASDTFTLRLNCLSEVGDTGGTCDGAST